MSAGGAVAGGASARGAPEERPEWCHSLGAVPLTSERARATRTAEHLLEDIALGEPRAHLLQRAIRLLGRPLYPLRAHIVHHHNSMYYPPTPVTRQVRAGTLLALKRVREPATCEVTKKVPSCSGLGLGLGLDWGWA